MVFVAASPSSVAAAAASLSLSLWPPEKKISFERKKNPKNLNLLNPSNGHMLNYIAIRPLIFENLKKFLLFNYLS